MYDICISVGLFLLLRSKIMGYLNAFWICLVQRGAKCSIGHFLFEENYEKKG